MTRNDAREKTLDAIYSCLIQEQAHLDYDPEEIIKNIFHAEKFEDIDMFGQEVFVQALKNRDEIVSLIQPNLNRWTFSRLNLTAQAILLEAVSECKYAQLTPKAIACNCAVNLAKRYLDAKDYKYINAVLDKVL